MRRALLVLLLVAAMTPAADFSFEIKEIDTSLTVGYAVLLVDVNADGKKDIVVVDTQRVIWYENPTWKRRNILVGKTPPDNVCISAADIDGDGRVDFALGAGWKPFDTKGGGSLHWLRQPKDLDREWDLFAIGSEPTMHRIRFAPLDRQGDKDAKPVLIAGPLMGRDSSRENNWLDGRPLRVLAYRIPNDPTREKWPIEVIDESLHVMHNFDIVPTAKGVELLTASYLGVHRFFRQEGKWHKQRLHEANQSNPKGSRGASEIKHGKRRDGTRLIATIEPWHGNQVVLYTPDAAGKWQREVLDDQLLWGHAVWFADLDGDGGDELVIGVRDDKAKSPSQRRGVRIYRWVGKAWQRQLVDEGGVAVEDLAVADLNNDGRLDIVAVGRATKNVRIYWQSKGR
ncbi:MAG: VCBS repeat-containing protein [Gemmataceae bacterium]